MFFLPFLTPGRFVTDHAAATHLNRALIRILYAQNPVKRTVSVQLEGVSGWAEKGGYDPVNTGFPWYWKGSGTALRRPCRLRRL